MQSLRFIHAADLHLDSPFRGLARTSPKLRETLQGATMGALERIVDHTIACAADFLVVAGDLYDCRDRSLRALIAFRKQMERLAEHGINAYLVHGNHDPLSGWGSGFRLPPNVTTFGEQPGTEPVIRQGREIARVTGVSYSRERVTENLAATLRPEKDSPYSIALLHANIGGQTGHADYAPATLGDLAESGFHYWALGHVHTRSILASSPCAVVYPGNPQGRNARETGPRGCFQVDVDGDGNARLEFVETNCVRWFNIEMSIQAYTRMDDLMVAMLDRAREAVGTFAGPIVARFTLRGCGPLHRDLQRDGMGEELCSELQPVLPVESVRMATSPAMDFTAIARTETLAGDFLRLAERSLEDPELRQRLTASIWPLYRRKELSMPEEARLKEWIQQAAAMGVDLLMDS